jgi:hypothetical protein
MNAEVKSADMRTTASAPEAIANPIASWSAAGSETPRRLRPREKLSSFRKPCLRTKAVSRLCLATALHDASRNPGIVANAEASWLAATINHQLSTCN